MKTYRVTFKGKNSTQSMRLVAKDEAEARELAEQAQARRHGRFPLTFARLEQAKETGAPGLLAIDPKKAGGALTEAFVKAEVEKRKRDQARYDDGELKITKVEEAQ